MEPTKQQIFEAFKKLPDPIRKYVVSVEASHDMVELGKKKGLTDVQTSKLANQSGLFLMRLTSPEALAGEIQSVVEVEASLAETLATYIKDVIAAKSEKFVPTEEVAIEDQEEEDEQGTVQNNVAQPQRKAIHDSFFIPTKLVSTQTPRVAPVPTPPASSAPVSPAPKPAPAASIPATPTKQITPTSEPLPDMPVAERETVIKKLFPNDSFDTQLETQLEGKMIKQAPVPTNLPTSQSLQKTAPTPSILGARLGGSFAMPKEEMKVPQKQAPITVPPATLFKNNPSTPPQKYPNKDPYRESIE